MFEHPVNVIQLGRLATASFSPYSNHIIILAAPTEQRKVVYPQIDLLPFILLYWSREHPENAQDNLSFVPFHETSRENKRNIPFPSEMTFSNPRP